MPSSRDLINRPDIWRKDLQGRLDRLHRAAQDADAAYAEVEARDEMRNRRAAKRQAAQATKYPGLDR